MKSDMFKDLKPHHYRCIAVDIPWHFKVRGANGEGRSPKYQTMGLGDIKAMPVHDLAADDCVLLLWITDPHLIPAGEAVIKAWGFTYKTVGFYWVKLNLRAPVRLTEEGETCYAGGDFFTGLGYWTRANPELCLLATKGAPKRQDNSVRRLIIERRREHSRKPDEFYNRAQALVPGPYLDLFSREERTGWDTWGNEKGKF